MAGDRMQSESIGLSTEKAATSIEIFCENHGISRAFYYKLPTDLRPAEIRVGRRVLISREAASAWREKMTRRETEGVT